MTGPSGISGAEPGAKGRQAPHCTSLHLSSATLLPNVHLQLPEVVSVTEKERGTWSPESRGDGAGCHFKWAGREDLTGKRSFKQRAEWSDRLKHTDSWQGELLGGLSTRPRRGPPARAGAPLLAKQRRDDRPVGGHRWGRGLPRLESHCLQGGHPAPLYLRPPVLPFSTCTLKSKQ